MVNQIQIQGRDTSEIKESEEKKKAEAALKKQPPKVPEKIYYTVVLECLVPCTLTYRVFAESEVDAIEKMQKQNPTNIKTHIPKKRNIKATVYAYGSNLIKFVKNFRV